MSRFQTWMSKLCSLFQEAKAPEHVSSLRVRDGLRFSDSFGLPVQIRDKVFKVKSIGTYVSEYGLSPEWVLEGDQVPELYLAIGDAEDNVVINMPLSKKAVERVLGLDAVKATAENEGHEWLYGLDIHVFEGWMKHRYLNQAKDIPAMYFDKDCRGKGLPSKGQPLKYSYYLDESGCFGIRLDVWQDRQIDVYLSLIRPLDDIHQYLSR